MKKRLLALLLAALLTGCAGGGGADSAAPSPDSGAASSSAAASSDPADVPPPAVIEKDPLEAYMETMSLADKVGQLFFVRCPAEDAAADIGTYRLGGYILFGRDTKDKTANDLIQTIRAWQETAAGAMGIPLLIGVDEEGGSVVRVSSNPHLRSEKFPSPQRIFAAGGMEAMAPAAREKDALLQGLGFNVNLAPVCDVSTDPADFIYDRTLGQDAEATAGYVRETVGAMTADGMGSVLKHFPGYGGNADTHTGIALDERPYEDFVNGDFLPFRAGMEAGGETTAVLVSHNIVSCMDGELPASLSPAVHQILRDELGFDGVAMTDDLAMAAVSAYAGDGAVAVMALQAGNDLVITSDYRAQIPAVIAAVEQGQLSMETIDTACRRVLRWKAALGLLDMA